MFNKEDAGKPARPAAPFLHKFRRYQPAIPA